MTRPPRLPPSGRLVGGPQVPRRWRRAVRPAVSLTLLAAFAGTAAWSGAQVAERARTVPGRPAITTPAPASTISSERSPAPAASPGRDHRSGRRSVGTGPHRRGPHARPSATRPGGGTNRTGGRAPGRPSAGRTEDGRATAECARRFPDQARRRACARYLRQLLDD